MKFQCKFRFVFYLLLISFFAFFSCASSKSFASKKQEISKQQKQGKRKKVDCSIKSNKEFKAKSKRISTYQQKKGKIFGKKKKKHKKPKVITKFAWENPWISTYKIKNQKNKKYK